MSEPLVSIIMTTYNCKESLREILEAADRQDYDNLEIVVKDGKSTDGTLDIIQEVAKTSAHPIVWVSEKDTGIYDAMNQGFALSHGDIVVFCADLIIGSDVVTKMVHAIECGGASCIGAHGDLVYADGNTVKRYWHMGNGKIREGWMPGHPTLYLKRSVLDQYGLYKTTYRIAADYEFMVRILKDDANTLAYVPEIIVNMSYGGTSTGSAGSYRKSLQEANLALRENGISHPWLVSMRRTFRLMRQFQEAKKINRLPGRS